MLHHLNFSNLPNVKTSDVLRFHHIGNPISLSCRRLSNENPICLFLPIL